MTVAVEIRLGDDDWAKYGGPEWLTLDWDVFDDMETDQLTELEAEMGFSITSAKLRGTQMLASGMKAFAWLARQTSGDPALKTPGWEGFKIRPRRIDTRKVGDARPPADGSPSSKLGETQETTGESSTSSPAADLSPTSEPS